MRGILNGLETLATGFSTISTGVPNLTNEAPPTTRRASFHKVHKKSLAGKDRKPDGNRRISRGQDLQTTQSTVKPAFWFFGWVGGLVARYFKWVGDLGHGVFVGFYGIFDLLAFYMSKLSWTVR